MRNAARGRRPLPADEAARVEKRARALALRVAAAERAAGAGAGPDGGAGAGATALDFRGETAEERVERAAAEMRLLRGEAHSIEAALEDVRADRAADARLAAEARALSPPRVDRRVARALSPPRVDRRVARALSPPRVDRRVARRGAPRSRGAARGPTCRGRGRGVVEEGGGGVQGCVDGGVGGGGTGGEEMDPILPPVRPPPPPPPPPLVLSGHAASLTPY